MLNDYRTCERAAMCKSGNESDTADLTYPSGHNSQTDDVIVKDHVNSGIRKEGTEEHVTLKISQVQSLRLIQLSLKHSLIIA